MSTSRNYLTQPIRHPYGLYDYIDEPLSNTDVSFLAATSKIALTSTYRFRVAALVVKSGRVLGGDVNIHKITPDTPPERMSTHAEMRVLRSASSTKGATMYIARLKSKDEAGLAKPCVWCLNHMLEAGITRVVFTTNTDTGTSFYTNMITWK